MDILFECIRNIPKHIVIHRITGDAPKSLLIEPLWSANKKNVLNTINKEMKNRSIIQGDLL
jgi:radical SAM superfamily enzyme